MSRQKCPICQNDDTCLLCEHTAPLTCVECERDENAVVISGDCFFCLCEGKIADNFDYKPRDVLGRALEVAELGEKRKKLGLSPPILKNDIYRELHKLFMYGYNSI